MQDFDLKTKYWSLGGILHIWEKKGREKARANPFLRENGDEWVILLHEIKSLSDQEEEGRRKKRKEEI